MFNIFSQQRPLSRRGQALDVLLRQNASAFVDAVSALEVAERKRLLAQGAGRAWCETARSCDKVEALITLHALAMQDDALEHLPSWGRSRALMGFEGWRSGRPMMALLHVGSGGASVRRYQRRFKDASGWQKLVEERCISPHAYTAQFGVSFPVLKRWCDQGILNTGTFAALLHTDTDAVMQAVSLGEIQTAEILRRCATEEEGATWAQHFLQHGIGPCPIWMERHASHRTLAMDLARQGHLPVEQLLSCIPRIDAASMRALRDAGHATHWHALRAGALDSAEIRQLVDDGTEPSRIVQGGLVPPELVHTWVADGSIDKDAFVQASLAHWRMSDPMPPYHYEAAQNAWGPYLLLRNLRMPQALQARMAYAARQMSMHLWHRVKPIDLEASCTVHAADVGACSICLEPFGENKRVASLVGCEHPPAMCQGCLVRYVETSDDAYPVCVAPACKKPILPEDVIRAGGSVTVAHTLALDAVRRQLLHSAVWWACPTRGCVGGTLLGVDVGINHHCRVCEQVTLVRRPGVDWRRDTDKILRLVDGLQAAAKGEETRIRECPQCGVPTEHNGGCAHMNCRECGANWNFSLGLSSGYAPKGADNEQTYVPRAGLLVTAGLYEGVAPGPQLYEAVSANARRLQLMPSAALVLAQGRP